MAEGLHKLIEEERNPVGELQVNRRGAQLAAIARSAARDISLRFAVMNFPKNMLCNVSDAKTAPHAVLLQAQ